MILPLIQKRRSIRKYQKKPIEPDKIQTLVEAALRSPSSMGYNPWEFVVVADAGLLDKLSKARPQGSAHIKNAPLGIVVCADVGREQHKGYWVQDCAAATQNILLACHALGLGAVWIGVYPRDSIEAKFREFGMPIVTGAITPARTDDCLT